MGWKFEARSLANAGRLVGKTKAGGVKACYYNDDEKKDPRTIIAMDDDDKGATYGVMTAYSAMEAEWLVKALNLGAAKMTTPFPYDPRRKVKP